MRLDVIPDDVNASTPERILDAAERLFAERGLEGASLRAIMREAGVNPAAIHYHFGSKEALLRGVLDRVIEPLNARRFELLDAARARAGAAPLEVEELLRAFLLPDLEVIDGLRDRAHVARFIGRCYAQPTPFIEQLMQEQFGPVAERFYPELARALPWLPLDELDWRMHLVVGAVLGMFATAASRDGDEAGGESAVEGLLDRIVAFGVGGLTAPVARLDVQEGAAP